MKQFNRFWFLLLVWLCGPTMLVGCNGSSERQEVHGPDYISGTCLDGDDCGLFGVALRFYPRRNSAGFFDTPWPCNIRRTEDGQLDLGRFPNPSASSMLSSYVQTISDNTRWFGTNSAIFFTFTGSLDSRTLPLTTQETIRDDSSVFLVDLTPGAHHGERVPLAVRFFGQQRQFTPENTLVLRPVLSFGLRQQARYAAVVTRDVRSEDGRTLGTQADFERTKYWSQPEDEILQRYWQLFSGVYADLEELYSLERSQIAALTVFTTQDVTRELEAISDVVTRRASTHIFDWRYVSAKPDLHRLEGWYQTLEFQVGQPPDYEGGGAFFFDAQGLPVVQREVAIPFTLAVPTGQPPVQGWPVVMYAHGTGGSRNSFIDAQDDVADKLARRGLASISIDQPLHASRNPWGRDEDLITFNAYNILAMRDNFRQAAADLFVLEKIVQTLSVPANLVPGKPAIVLDANRLAFMGHSQGSLNGPLYNAVSSQTKGVVYSGAGGGLGPALLGKEKPVDIPALIVTAMGLVPEEFDLDHPLISVFQTFAERADPLNYARRHNQKHVFVSQGLLDDYALPEQAAALAGAMDCAPMKPIVEPIEVFSLRGQSSLDPPVSGNRNSEEGVTTCVMVQYPQDGHFALFNNSDAQRHYLDFLQSVLAGQVPAVGP